MRRERGKGGVVLQSKSKNLWHTLDHVSSSKKSFEGSSSSLTGFASAGYEEFIRAVACTRQGNELGSKVVGLHQPYLLNRHRDFRWIPVLLASSEG